MTYATYILASRTRTLYIGATNDLPRRMMEHRQGLGARFPHKYRCDALVYFELGRSRQEVLDWERRLKGWTRAKKIALIEATNPGWSDLAKDWNLGKAE
ncbi:MAG TPA: GIY-YIG nuclease family protein [Gemmatimonadales bacterium]|nr:GIY-YIG nuclease family protein [Gemmatimonadales bacterium]